MPHPRAEAFWQIPHRRDRQDDKCPGVDGHASNWLKWCTLYFQKLVELSFVADEVSLVAFVSVFVSFFSVLFLGMGTARGDWLENNLYISME